MARSFPRIPKSTIYGALLGCLLLGGCPGDSGVVVDVGEDSWLDIGFLDALALDGPSLKDAGADVAKDAGPLGDTGLVRDTTSLDNGGGLDNGGYIPGLAESITAYGRYWNFSGTSGKPWPSNGSLLSSVPRYASGPCKGKPTAGCTFDSRTFASDGGVLLESITAYGRYWNFEVNNGSKPLPSNGSLLSSVPRYASGPCKGKPTAGCTFDSRTFTSDGGVLLESITAYGRYWNFEVENGSKPLPSNGSLLSSVPRYASGPCGTATGSCMFDSRTFASVGGVLLESVTAYGRYWNFEADNGHKPLPSNGSLLSTVPRYVSGPCKGKTNTCTFDTRTFVLVP